VRVVICIDDLRQVDRRVPRHLALLCFPPLANPRQYRKLGQPLRVKHVP